MGEGRFRSWSRRSFCRQVALAPVAVAACRGMAAAAGSSFCPESVEYLRGISRATVSAARVLPGEFKPGGGENRTGITLITPGGNYPAFWCRDYIMSLDCGLIGPEEMLPQLRLIAGVQHGPRERRLASGARIPPYSIADHIRMDGRPVFYPGTMNPGHFQGFAPFGPLPIIDSHYYFVHLAWALWRDLRDRDFLLKPVGGMPVVERLINAFHVPVSDPGTGAVVTEDPRRAVGFGFNDTIYMLGAMSFVTLLRWQAATELAELLGALGRGAEAGRYRGIADTIAANLTLVFSAPSEIGGWLRAATRRCREPDVWATLYALHLGVLPAEAEKRARETVAGAVSAPGHVIEYQGAVRQVPTTHDFSDRSAWEDSRLAGKGVYQNGAYWHTATGWLIDALYPLDRGLALGVFDRYLAHLRRYDFRRSTPPGNTGANPGAPWECFGLDLEHAQNPVYMTSVTVPLGVVERLV